MVSWVVLAAIWGVQVVGGPANDFDATRAAGLNSDQIANGWLALFDGHSEFGWRRESKTNWQVEGGHLLANSGEVGLLRTAVEFDDFELRLEYRTGPDSNSGVFIRTSPQPKSTRTDCYEVNIAPSPHPFPTCSIVDHAKAESVQPKVGWNQMRIVASGPKIRVWFNDELKLDFEAQGKYLRRGYIGLQHNRGKIEFRNVHIRPLNLDSLFDGVDLNGWNSDQALVSRFYIDDENCLKMMGGRGQLESKDRFADFVFQTHVRTNAEGLNSGVFFRCIPGDVMNGYESQIQNQFKDGDPTKPVDCGTGGIFRRQNARVVNASDNAWFAKTIITSGATICVWVNGYLVADWNDRRKRNTNPRKGLRLEAGTFCLQGHDPTTDVSFRKMFVRELSVRK